MGPQANNITKIGEGPQILDQVPKWALDKFFKLISTHNVMKEFLV